MTDVTELMARLAGLRAKALVYLGDGDWTTRANTGWIDAPSKLPDGGPAHVADVRGWGYLTGRGTALRLGDAEAIAAQAVWANLIIESVNAVPALAAEIERLRAALQQIDAELIHELNEYNYTHDDVCELNTSAVNACLLARAALAPAGAASTDEVTP